MRKFWIETISCLLVLAIGAAFAIFANRKTGNEAVELPPSKNPGKNIRPTRPSGYMVLVSELRKSGVSTAQVNRELTEILRGSPDLFAKEQEKLLLDGTRALDEAELVRFPQLQQLWNKIADDGEWRSETAASLWVQDTKLGELRNLVAKSEVSVSDTLSTKRLLARLSVLSHRLSKVDYWSAFRFQRSKVQPSFMHGAFEGFSTHDPLRNQFGILNSKRDEVPVVPIYSIQEGIALEHLRSIMSKDFPNAFPPSEFREFYDELAHRTLPRISPELFDKMKACLTAERKKAEQELQKIDRANLPLAVEIYDAFEEILDLIARQPVGHLGVQQGVSEGKWAEVISSGFARGPAEFKADDEPFVPDVPRAPRARPLVSSRC